MHYKFEKNNEYGFYEVNPKPTAEELKKYYAEKYYQNEQAIYQHKYEDAELRYFDIKIEQKYHLFKEKIDHLKKPSLLDVGCGEGFTMNFLSKTGWQVRGIDFSDEGIKNFNPHLLANFTQGDVVNSLDQLTEKGEKFDVIWLDNVLEHVIDPLTILKYCAKLGNKNGVLVVEVPYDYSDFQQALFKDHLIEKEHWKAYPDHLSYFSPESLTAISTAANWSLHRLITDYPIETNLANRSANYAKNRSLGKAAHDSRMYIETFLHEKNTVEEVNDFYENMLSVGLGRQLIAAFTLDEA